MQADSYTRLSETPAFLNWSKGFGVITHGERTRRRIVALADRLVAQGAAPDHAFVFDALAATDRLTSAAMWLVVHMTYASKVSLSGRPMLAEDFKRSPEGHTGGALNMVPAYVGYFAANLLTGKTRSWIMGQGHCVAAIEAVNALTDNLSEEQAPRYPLSDAGLTQLARDFYSYEVTPEGRPAAPLGSHVNVHTAGGISEGGYLGFAELQYVHMPLRGESLVAFLSDGAFEEQRGSDWSPRWWRAEDSGVVMPIMVMNGRRIEQRTGIVQEGGASWLKQHLQLNGFDPIDVDGHDPADYAWAVLEIEQRFAEIEAGLRNGTMVYPACLPYAIASCVKGFGFPGAGTNRAHNLPLVGNPHTDASARVEFNVGAGRLFVPPEELDAARLWFGLHEQQNRVREGCHPLARRSVALPAQPAAKWRDIGDAPASPMQAIDEYFVDLVGANPQLRVRVGNPDELRSNQMGGTLDTLKHRADAPEPGLPEAVDGAVITVLNEEAVVGAALGNKAGLNLVVSYEAFGVKMLGALRQDILFARHQREAGREPGWLGLPVLLTSHTWENGKNEQSHQDPTLCEAMMGEMSETSRVLFPVDANSAVAAMREIYSAHGVIAALVVPKRPVTVHLDAVAAQRACQAGATAIGVPPHDARVQLVAVGAYQLREAMRAAQRLAERGYPASVACIIEPGKLRVARDELEAEHVWEDAALEGLFPPGLPRVLVCHCRPEPMLGVLRRIDQGPNRLRALGYINHGGTLDIDGMLFANRCTWAHIVQAAAQLSGVRRDDVLDEEECLALDGKREPTVLWR